MRVLICIFTVVLFSACDVLNYVIQETTALDLTKRGVVNLVQSFNAAGPISTTFDDAIYEVEALHNFEPDEAEYALLGLQPTSPNDGYNLKSGLYTMNAKSFCLRGYTYGPSRGDGHLYAPLKGKKADLVQLIIERYGARPHVPQRNVQVLLWAIISGADMNSLGIQYAHTLQELFSPQELIAFQGKEWLNGMAEDQIQRFKTLALNNMSPKLQKLLEADKKIRDLVHSNQSFQQIERIAIIAGIAPSGDMIRQVSKGRWSYHPDGYFIRFFPEGYARTRVDVFVPFEGQVVQNGSGSTRLSNEGLNYLRVKAVTFNPASMVAVPANQSSQRIGVSSVPVTSIPRYRTPETNCHPDSLFDAGRPRYAKEVDGLEIRGSIPFIKMVERALSTLKGDFPNYYHYYLSPEDTQLHSPVKGIGIDCHYGINTLDAFLYIRLSVKSQWHYDTFNDIPEIAAGTIIHEAVHVHQANAYMNTIGEGSFEKFLEYYAKNKNSFELAATKKQIEYLDFALNKYHKGSPAYKEIKYEIERVKKYENKHMY